MDNNLFTKEEILKIFSKIKESDVSYMSDTLIKINKDCCQLSVSKSENNKTYVSMTINSIFHANVFNDENYDKSFFNELASYITPEIDTDNFKKIIFNTFA